MPAQAELIALAQVLPPESRAASRRSALLRLAFDHVGDRIKACALSKNVDLAITRLPSFKESSTSSQDLASRREVGFSLNDNLRASQRWKSPFPFVQKSMCNVK